MTYLFLKYYFRNTLWATYYPAVFILLELAAPFNLTVIPFFFIMHGFTVSNYFTPFTERIIYATNYSYLKAVLLNNIVSLITGVFWFVVIGSIIAIYRKLFASAFDFHVFYEFLPLLIWAIALGNICIYFIHKWPQLINWFATIYKGFLSAFIFFVFLVVYNSSAILSSEVLASGLMATLLSYYLIDKDV